MQDYEPTEEIHFNEAELQSLYTDLLSHDETTPSVEDVPAEEVTFDPEAVLRSVADRLFPVEVTSMEPSESSTSALASRLKPESGSSHPREGLRSEGLAHLLDGKELHHKIISRLVNTVMNLERVPSTSHSASVVPVNVLTEREWRALVRTTVSLVLLSPRIRQ